MDFANLLEPMVKSSILVEYDSHPAVRSPIGASKIGGQPDLPAGFEWPYFEGAAYDGVTANRPLSFLAQINCKEASMHDKDSLLPSEGMLYFFYELTTITWGFGHEEKNSSRVYYFKGSTSDLDRADLPEDLSPECRIPEMPITFSSRIELPDFEEFMALHDDGDRRQWPRIYREQVYKYDEARDSMAPTPDSRYISKLLGYANLVQDEMLLQCELVSGGNELGSDGYTIATPQQRHDCTRWQLLFQIDSIDTDGYELLWYGSGRLYFYIDRNDLKAMDFNRCMHILQST